MGIYADKKSKVSNKNSRKKPSSSIYYDLPIVKSQRSFNSKDNENSDNNSYSEARMKYLMENYKSIVHYNSPEPKKYGAKAFTKNSEIYIAPGEESALPHELAHVYQQKTQDIPATDEINGEKVNTDPKLEEEAYKMAKGNIKDLSLLKGKNRTKDIIQFDFDPKNPGAHQEERRDYYKDKPTITEKLEMVNTDAEGIDWCENIRQVSTKLKNILKKYWPDSVVEPTVNLDGMNLELAKANAKQLIRLLSKYSTSIHDIKIENMELGRASVSGEFETTGGRTLKFSNEYFKNRDPIENTKEDFAYGERQQIRFGNHAEVRTQEEKKANDAHIVNEAYKSEIEKLLKYTVTHEFGHSILNYLALDRSLITQTQTNIHDCIDKIYNMYIKKYGSSPSTDNNFISEYAKTSKEEFIAESFAQAELSSNPDFVSVYAKKLMEIIDTFFAWNPKVKPEDFNWNNFRKSLNDL